MTSSNSNFSENTTKQAKIIKIELLPFAEDLNIYYRHLAGRKLKDNSSFEKNFLSWSGYYDVNKT